ncbi:MAG: hypothetical protein ACPL6D_16795 [Thermodesulfobacteriota bacterium]
MIITYSKNMVPIRLTIERWGHIICRHPELTDEKEKEKVIEAIEKPEMILKGDFGTFMAVRFYRETSLSEKYLVVTYREVNKNDGFVVTAYFTNKLSEEREILWKQ